MKLHNTLTRQIDELTPLNNNTVKIYTCGLTVYSQPHIGNWVGYIYWDVLIRLLRSTGYTVERTQNYTDVGHLVSDDDSGEDKMEKGARSEGLTAWDIAEKYIAIAEHEGYELLGLLRPDHLVRATDYIQQQIDFAKILDEKGFTYVIPDEGLYFDTSKLSDYGKLAQLDIAGLEAGARVSIEGKRNITDFAIWKFSPKDQQRDMEWESPWGKGFPGWHLECSAIARETLGDQIDIHTGGIDHIPVHHTNEIAQTEAVTDKPFSQFWIHNNHLKVDGTKISKSLGNIYTLQDILDKGFDIDAFKLMILSKHYSTEGNFTWENLEAAQNHLNGLKAAADLKFQPVNEPTYMSDYIGKTPLLEQLSNNLDTPRALAVFNGYTTLAAQYLICVSDVDAYQHDLELFDDLFGMNLARRKDITLEDKQLISERENARVNEDWVKSDKLRDKLQEQGIGLNDTPNGTIWYRI